MPSRVVPFRSKQPLWQERGDLLPKDLGVPKNEKARRSLLSVLLLKVSTWRISCGWGLFKGPYLRPYNFEDLSFTDFSFHGPNCFFFLVEKSLGLESLKLFSFFLAQNVLISYHIRLRKKLISSRNLWKLYQQIYIPGMGWHLFSFRPWKSIIAHETKKFHHLPLLKTTVASI